MKSNMGFVTKGMAGLNLLRLGTGAGTRKGYSKMWFMALLLVVLIAGCNGSNPSLGGGGCAFSEFKSPCCRGHRCGDQL